MLEESAGLREGTSTEATEDGVRMDRDLLHEVLEIRILDGLSSKKEEREELEVLVHEHRYLHLSRRDSLIGSIAQMGLHPGLGSLLGLSGDAVELS